jgi:hypothetical protein
VKVTAETITLDEIRTLEREGRELIAMAVAARTPHRGQKAARARCAAAWNARHGGEP